jgi:hypothetical protein
MSLYICTKYGFDAIKARSINRELGFDSSALIEAKVNYVSYNTKAAYEHNTPLQAEIRKYPHSVTSLNAKCTTGLVCPLQVNGVCRKFAIFIGRNKTVLLRFVCCKFESIDNVSIRMIIEYCMDYRALITDHLLHTRSWSQTNIDTEYMDR